MLGQTNTRSAINVTSFGATGNGVTDDTAAINAAAAAGPIFMPCGTYLISNTIKLNPSSPRLDGESGTFRCVVIVNTNPSVPAISFTSPIRSAQTDLGMAVHISGFLLFSQSGIQINAAAIPAPPAYQSALVKLDIREVNMQGGYGSATDANKWTGTIPSVASMQAQGVGLSCTECFGLILEGSIIQNFGVGVYYQGDESLIEGNRITFNGNNIIVATMSGPSGNNNVITANTLGANVRVPSVRLVATAGATKIQGNYFENYCPSSTFVYSTDSSGTDFSFNEIDNPNNPSTAGLCGNVANSQPMLILDDLFEVRIHDNHVGFNGRAVPSLTLNNSYGNNNQYYIYNNSAGFPVPYVMNMSPSGSLNPVITGSLTVSSAGPTLTGGSGTLNLGDATISKAPGGGFTFGSGLQANGLYSVGVVYGYTYQTDQNCSNTASPAYCASAAAGSVVVAPGSGAVTVQTSAATAKSQIMITFDSSLGPKLGVTCNPAVPAFGISARNPGYSFTIAATPSVGNPACFSYTIIN